MKKLISKVVFLLAISQFFTLSIYASETEFNEEELNWIDEHKSQEIHIGLAPYEGIDLFEYDNIDHGYLIDIAEIFQDETGITFVIDANKPWGEAYSGLIDGETEVLFGANPTEERLNFMSFTRSVYNYPYVALAKKGSEIHTIGDLDSNRIGFIEGDMVIELFKEQYKNIQYTFVEYDDPEQGIYGVINNDVEGFITANTEIVTELLYNHNFVDKIAELNSINSEMTFSTLQANQVLARLLDKVIVNKNDEINQTIIENRIIYMHKILELTQEEKLWLNNNPIIRFGAVTDYLPIDYYNEDKEYAGVAGEFLNEFTSMIGLKVEAVPGTFDLQGLSNNLLTMIKS